MNHSNTYTVYHLHSDDSLLDSCTKFEDYVDLAVQQGMTAIASTEHGKTTGWVKKKLYCDKQGIKFIHGVEIYLTGEDTDVYKTVSALEIGNVVDVEGFLYWYEGVNPHITAVTVVA